MALPSLERHLKSNLRHLTLPTTTDDVIARLQSLQALQTSFTPDANVSHLIRQHPAVLLLDTERVAQVQAMLTRLAPKQEWVEIAVRNPHVFYLDPLEVS